MKNDALNKRVKGGTWNDVLCMLNVCRFSVNTGIAIKAKPLLLNKNGSSKFTDSNKIKRCTNFTVLKIAVIQLRFDKYCFSKITICKVARNKICMPKIYIDKVTT